MTTIRTLSAEDRRRCVDLAAANLSTRQIATFIGTSHTTVRAVLLEEEAQRCQSAAAVARHTRTSPRRTDAPYDDPELDDIRSLCGRVVVDRLILADAAAAIGRPVLWGLTVSGTHYYGACHTYVFGKAGNIDDKRARAPYLWQEGCSVLRIARTLDVRSESVTAWLRGEIESQVSCHGFGGRGLGPTDDMVRQMGRRWWVRERTAPK